MVHTIHVHADYRVTKILLSCLAYYIHFIFNLCRSYPGKEAKLFEYAKVPPDVAVSDSDGRQAPLCENKIPTTAELSFLLFFTPNTP